MVVVVIASFTLSHEQDLFNTNMNTLDISDINEEMQLTGKTTKYKDGQIVKYAGIISNIKK